jgi:type I restriction enzyme R subunit
MYIDRKLGGVNAVQTISRLNRVYPGKEETFVLDFVNDADAIQKSFEPYYDRTILAGETDPNLLYDLETRLLGFGLYSSDDVNLFASYYFAEHSTQDKLHAVLQPVVERYSNKSDEEKADFRSHLNDYIRLYAFLSNYSHSLIQI